MTTAKISSVPRTSICQVQELMFMRSMPLQIDADENGPEDRTDEAAFPAPQGYAAHDGSGDELEGRSQLPGWARRTPPGPSA